MTPKVGAENIHRHILVPKGCETPVIPLHRLNPPGKETMLVTLTLLFAGLVAAVVSEIGIPDSRGLLKFHIAIPQPVFSWSSCSRISPFQSQGASAAATSLCQFDFHVRIMEYIYDLELLRGHRPIRFDPL